MAETNWGFWVIATSFRVLILLFILWLLYRGVRKVTLWRWQGAAADGAYEDATARYAATVETPYVCQTCGVARDGRLFYFDVNGPDGHQIEQCMICTRRKADSGPESIAKSAKEPA